MVSPDDLTRFLDTGQGLARAVSTAPGLPEDTRRQLLDAADAAATAATADWAVFFTRQVATLAGASLVYHGVDPGDSVRTALATIRTLGGPLRAAVVGGGDATLDGVFASWREARGVLGSAARTEPPPWR